MPHGNNLSGGPAPTTQNMSHLWDQRGYRPPKVDQKNVQPEDERGEEAYMRAFEESQKIGRVPNPAFFTNSASAKGYIARRDAQLFGQARTRNESGKPRTIPNPNFVPIVRAPKQGGQSAQPPSQPTISMTPSVSLAAKAEGPEQKYMPGAPRVHNETQASGIADTVNTSGYHTGPQFRDPYLYHGQVPPLTMEPTFGPVGPPKMLR